MSNRPELTGPGSGQPLYSAGEAASVLVLVIAVTLVLSLVTGPLNQVADPVRKSLGIDDIQFSLLLGALFVIPSMVMTIAGGWLADRISRRYLLLTAMLCWTVGGLWSAFATTYHELAAARFVIAATAGIKFPLVMTWVSDAYPPERRGKAIGAVFVIIGIAPAIGATLSGIVLHASQQGLFDALPWIGAREPWRIAVCLLALSNLLVAPWILGLRDRRRQSPGANATRTTTGRRFRPNWIVCGVVLATALLTLADNANLAWLPTVLSRQYGLDAQQVGFTFGLIVTLAGSLGPLIGGVLDGLIYRRGGTRGRLVACSIATLLCVPLLAAFLSSNTRLLIGALITSGMLTMLTSTISFVALQSLLASRNQGFGIGIAQAMNNLAAGSAPTIVAFAAAGLPSSTSSLGEGIALVTTATFLATSSVCALCAWALNRNVPQQLPDRAPLAAPNGP